METHEIIETLEATPIWMRAGLARLPEKVAWQAPGAGEWSPAQVIAHLRASDAILAPRVYQLLTRPHAPLTGFDERTWAEIVARARLPLANQLAAFEMQRAELVGVLRTLTDVEWAIVGQHETRGALSVQVIATDLAAHEREHRAQLESAIAAVRPAVGSERNGAGRSSAGSGRRRGP